MCQILGSESQKHYLFMTFSQTADKFLDVLKENNATATKVPTNMIHLFQPLHLTVNKFAKDFIKQKLSNSKQVC